MRNRSIGFRFQHEILKVIIRNNGVCCFISTFSIGDVTVVVVVVVSKPVSSQSQSAAPPVPLHQWQ